MIKIPATVCRDGKRTLFVQTATVCDGMSEIPLPKGPSTHYLRTLGPLGVPKPINKDYLEH